MTINEAIIHLQTIDFPDKNHEDTIKAHANGAMDAAVAYGEEGLQVTCKQILSHLDNWVGPEADKVKEALEEYSCRKILCMNIES